MTEYNDLESQQTEQFYRQQEHNAKLRERAEQRELDKQLDDQQAVNKILQAQVNALNESLKEAGITQEQYFQMPCKFQRNILSNYERQEKVVLL